MSSLLPNYFICVLLFAVPPDIINLFPKHTIKEALSNVTLECSATGCPTPTIQWKFNGQVLSTNQDIDIMHNKDGKCSTNSCDGQCVSNSTVYIKSVHIYHQGIFLCVANNLAGDDIETARVTVTGN